MIQKIFAIGHATFLKAVIIFGLITVLIFGLNYYGVIHSIQLGNLLALPFSIAGIISFIGYAICLFFTKDRTVIQKNIFLTVIGFVVALIFFLLMTGILWGSFSGYGV